MKKLPSIQKNACILTFVIVFLLLISILWIMIGIFLPGKKEEAKTACIYQDGTLIQTIPLSIDAQDTCITITAADGSQNVIQTKGASIAVTSADCPDKLCVHRGYVSDSLLPIVCLPNRLVIRIVPANDESSPSGADTLTY